MAHSPGPWHWEKSTDRSREIMPKLIAADGTTVCDLGDAEPYDAQAGSEPNEDDEKLIAAAPEMLELLREEAKRENNWQCDDVDGPACTAQGLIGTKACWSHRVRQLVKRFR